MTEIDSYVRIVFFRQNTKGSNMPGGYVRRREMTTALKEAVEAALAPFVDEPVNDTASMSERLFDELKKAEVFVEINDKFAGAYFIYSLNQYAQYRQSVLHNDPVNQLAEAIGSRFFSDVFGSYLQDYNENADVVSGIEIPASDRIVSLNHNQVKILEEPIDEIVQQLEADNGIPDSPGLKERLLGQVRAGRELIRPGEFKAYILYVTLLRGLAELAVRYKDHVIGATAGKLVELLIEHVFGIKK